MTTNARTRDPRKIEADLDRTRTRVADTLDKLEHKFSPGELFDQALGYMRSRGNGELAPNFKQIVTRNPLPVTLVGLGLAWLMISGRRGSIPSEQSSQMQSDEKGQEGAMPFDSQADARDEFSGSTRGDRTKHLDTASFASEGAGPAAYGGDKAGGSGPRDEVATSVDEASPTRSDKAGPAKYGAESSSSGRDDRPVRSLNEASPTTTQTGNATSGARSGIKEMDKERLHRRT